MDYEYRNLGAWEVWMSARPKRCDSWKTISFFQREINNECFIGISHHWVPFDLSEAWKLRKASSSDTFHTYVVDPVAAIGHTLGYP